MPKLAFIIGAEGQDGYYLFENLKAKGYKLIGFDKDKVRHTLSDQINPIDITKAKQVCEMVDKYKPDEIYYLAAVHQSSEESVQNDARLFNESYLINVSSLVNFLDAIVKYSKNTRLFYAASSHIFGNPDNDIQDENTPFKPNSIYGISKTCGIYACRFYRKKYSVFVSIGILYNHESPRRSMKFVSRKIIKKTVEIKNKISHNITIGNINAKVDWGYAPDYVEAMHKILQHSPAEDFIIASGETHTVKEFIETAFAQLGMDWRKYVVEDTTLIKKSEKKGLQGNIGKIKSKIGWKPKVKFTEMINIMIAEEMKNVKP